MRLKGGETENIIRAIMADHDKYIRCSRTEDGYLCETKGKTNDVRKTLNEFLESVLYLERVSEKL